MSRSRTPNWRAILLVLLCLLCGDIVAAADGLPPAPVPVTISVDASKHVGPMRPVWRYFGADEPNYAYMKDGSKLIGELGVLRSNRVYFRAHNLLSTGDGTPA